MDTKPKSKVYGITALIMVCGVVAFLSMWLTLDAITYACERQQYFTADHQSYKCIPTGVWVP